MATTSGTGSPCGACKFLRRKCIADCIFAPYFCLEQGPARFAAIHKVFGASNVSKMLHHVAVADRSEAVVTIAYEAQARIKDPVYGCVAHIFALQQQVACLQAQLMQVKAQMGQSYMDSRNVETQWSSTTSNMAGAMAYQSYMDATNFKNIINTSPQSSMESINYTNEGPSIHEIQSQNDHNYELYKKRLSESDFDELQELAVRMMRN